MFPSTAVLTAEKLALYFSERLSEHLPGTDTGNAEITDKRTCWNKACYDAIASLARSYDVQMSISKVSEFSPEYQLNAIWYKDEAPVLVVGSAWSDRAELDRSFSRLLMLKAPQKLLIYSCKKNQADVLDQLSHAVVHFPCHVAGEEYVAVNIAGAEKQALGTVLRVTNDGSVPVSAAVFQPLEGSPYPFRQSKGREESRPPQPVRLLHQE
jgi:hypothetical protein